MEKSANPSYTAQLEELTRLMSFFNEKAEKAARPSLIEKLGNLGPANNRGQSDYKKYAKEIDPVLTLALQNKPEEAKKMLRQIAQVYIAEAQDARKGKCMMPLGAYQNPNPNALGLAFVYAKTKMNRGLSDQAKEVQLKKELEKQAQRHELFARKVAETMVKM